MIQNPDCLQFPGTSMRALLSAALKLSWGQERLARHHFGVFHCSRSKYGDFPLMFQIFHKKSNSPQREFPSIYCLSGRKKKSRASKTLLGKPLKSYANDNSSNNGAECGL